MTPSKIITALELLIRTQRPAFIQGSPGVGKSDILREAVKRLGPDWALIDCRALLLDPVDLRGLPHVSADGHSVWAIPGFLPDVKRHGEKGVFFVDELNAAPPMVQAAFYQLILDRRLGEYVLPDGWSVVAAGNNESDRAVAFAMPTALRNRFVHIKFEVSLTDWMAWGETHICPEILGYLKFRPDELNNFAINMNKKAFATPRSWAFASQLLEANPSPDIEVELIAGTIGDEAAGGFFAWLKKYRDMPSTDEILADPEHIPAPTDPQLKYAVSVAIARRMEKDTMKACWIYLSKMGKEYQIMAYKSAFERLTEAGRVADLLTSPEIKKFAIDNRDAFPERAAKK